MFVPIFAKPENVTTFADQSAFVAFLDEHGVRHQEWEEGRLAKLWKEIGERDAVYGTGARFGQPGLAVRFLITVAIRVIMAHPKHGRLVLIEYTRDEKDHYVPRKHEGSSLSEKVHVLPDGTLAEPLAYAVKFCLADEPEIALSDEELEPDRLIFMPWAQQPSEPVLDDAKRVELDWREGKPKYPSLWVFNQVAHYVLNVSPDHYHPGWHVDRATKYKSRWAPEAMMLEPIPAN